MLIATIPAILYIDNIGRKPALALGALGMGLCHFIIAIIYARNENRWETESASGWAAIVMGMPRRVSQVIYDTDVE